jgi:hypothetical protein
VELEAAIEAVKVNLGVVVEEKRELTRKVDGNVDLIWDSIRHMETSVNQRLTLAETSQVGSGVGGSSL